jgi:bacteriocin-like protein
MSKDKNGPERDAKELSDEQLEQVSGGGLLSSPLGEKLKQARSESVWVREIVEDVEAYD